MPVHSGQYTPESLERRRRLAEALMGQSMSGAPVGSHLQGIAQIASALVGTKMMRDAEKDEAAAEKRGTEHAQKLARSLMGGTNPANVEVAEFNAQSPGELQMVETTPQRIPDRNEAMELAMAPEGTRALQSNPVMAQMFASQFRPQESEPLETVIGPDGKPVLVARSQAAGKQPFTAQGGAQAAMLQEYNLYAQQMQQAGKQPLTVLEYIQARNPQNVTPSFSSIPLGDGTYGVLDQRTGEIRPTGQKAPPKSTQGAPTEGERTSANYLGRMEAAEGLLGGYTPSMPDYMAAQRMMSGGPVSTGIANQILSDEGQQYYQAAADWVRAKLRKESGAVISPEEMAQEIKTYFPVPGDSRATIEQKRRARLQAMEGMRQMGGRAAGPIDEMTIHPRDAAQDDPLGILK